MNAESGNQYDYRCILCEAPFSSPERVPWETRLCPPCMSAVIAAYEAENAPELPELPADPEDRE